MPRANANGIEIEYDVTGTGHPLLLVMGLGGQLIAWHDDFVDMLADRGFQVIRFDNRDIGLSTFIDAEPPSMRRLLRSRLTRRRPVAPYLLDDMADDAVGLLDALDISAAHVVGASMGGMIGQSMAIRFPERVSSLASIMSNTGSNRSGGIAPRVLVRLPRLADAGRENAVDASVELFRLIGGSHFDEAEHRQMAQQAIERHYDPRGPARQSAAIMASPDRTADLRAVTAPTLVVHGLQDTLVRPSGGVATAKAIPDARLLMFPEMGHDMPRALWPEMAHAIAANAARSARDQESVQAVGSH